MDSVFANISNTIVLFFLALCGWQIVSLIRLPVAPLLGPVFFIGFLVTSGIKIPDTPKLFFVIVPMMLGYSIGARLNKETIKQLRTMIIPVTFVVIWTLIIALVLGSFLTTLSHIDVCTAILSTSMGGLAEMAVIAMETDADVSIVIVMHLIRLLTTVTIFPFVCRMWMIRKEYYKISGDAKKATGFTGKIMILRQWFDIELVLNLKNQLTACIELFNSDILNFWNSFRDWLLQCLVAVVGGAFFIYIQFPAGAMVGSMLFIALASFFGMKVHRPSAGYYKLLQLGLGITISSNISKGTIVHLNRSLIIPIILSVFVIFVTSWGVAFLIHRVAKWDFPTCFLAAAPAGLTAMTALAITYGKDPLKVSILHLCRIISLKIVVPLFFWLLKYT